MEIDYSTDLGKLRLIIADTSDIPYLPNSVLLGVLADNEGSVLKSSKICAMYILGMMSGSTREKLANIEVYGDVVFKQYKEYLLLVYKDPEFALSALSPIPYSSCVGTVHPIIQFQKDFKNNYATTTDSEDLSLTADTTWQL
jgi:hypothetical protein